MIHSNYYLAFIANPHDFRDLVEFEIFTPEDFDNGWGYCIPTNWENSLEDHLIYKYKDEWGDECEEMLQDSEFCEGKCDGCIGIKSTYPKFNELISGILDIGYPDCVFFNFTGIVDASKMSKEELEKQEISKEEFCELLKMDSEFVVSICEMEPSG